MATDFPPSLLLLFLVGAALLPAAVSASGGATGAPSPPPAGDAGGRETSAQRAEATEPGIEFFRPGAPAHKIWPFDDRMPCTCQDMGCGCCADMVVSSFNFNRTGCMNLTYDPYEFAIIARMFFGEAMLFERSFSGKNPPPACMPVPMPYLPSVDFCVKFFDIYTPGRNVHMCMDWLARLQRAPVVVLHFDCLRVGGDGFALLKPEDGAGLEPLTPAPAPPPPPAPPVLAGGVSPDDVYDEVAPGKNSSSTLRDADHPDAEEGDGEATVGNTGADGALDGAHHKHSKEDEEEDT